MAHHQSPVPPKRAAGASPDRGAAVPPSSHGGPGGTARPPCPTPLSPVTPSFRSSAVSSRGSAALCHDPANGSGSPLAVWIHTERPSSEG